LVFVFYESGYLGLYDVRVSTYLMYFLGLFSFYISYVVGHNSNIKRKKKTTRTNILRFRYLLIILSLLSVFVLIKRCIIAIPFWISGGTKDLKYAIIQESALSIGYLWDGIYQYVARPMQVVLLVYIIMLFGTKRKDIILIILGLLVNALYFIASGAKFSILAFVILIFAYFLFYNSRGVVKQIAKHKGMSGMTMIVVIVIYNLMQVSSGGHVFDSIYTYICGCVPCSDIALVSIDSSPLTYGAVSFNGFLTFLKIPCDILGVFPEVHELADDCFKKMMSFENTVYISNTKEYNAFISMFSYFYADGGYLGVIFLSSLFGYLCQKINYNAFHNPTSRDVAFLFFITAIIVDTLVRFPLFFVTYFMTIVYIIIFFPKNNIQMNNN
jgi:oligosaccharide repeat unit polymerase